MNYETIQQIVKNNKGSEFSVIINGKKTKKRLFVTRNGDVCEFRKGSRMNGDFLWNKYDLDEWENVIPTDYTTNFINVIENVIKYLTISGMWVNLKNECEKILALGYDTLNEIIDIEQSFNWNTKWEMRNQMLADKGIENCSFFSFVEIAEKGIKNVTFDKNEKETHINAINHAFSTKGNFDCTWQKGYQNQVSIFTNCGGEFVGHFFEGKSFGHYNGYYLLDATHALFKDNE